MDRVVNYFKSVRDDVVRRHDDEVFSDGFNEAANLCVGLVTGKIESLLAQMKSGGLSDMEQRLFAELTDLKAEIEKQLYHYGSNSEDG